jgi:hypothetical protein
VTSLSVSIMAHKARADSALAIQRKISEDAGWERRVPICWDPNPVPSRDPAQRWATGRAAWEAGIAAGAEWHMVLQDDVLVTRDLIAGLERALDQMPAREGLVSAYTGTGRPDQANVRRALRVADDNGHSWMSTKSLNWGLAIIAPTWTIPDMLSWCSSPQWRRARVANYDYRIGVYYRDRKKWRTWHTVPSLVEHADGESLVGHGRGDRVAHRFIGEKSSALEVDWNRVPGGGLTPKFASPRK